LAINSSKPYKLSERAFLFARRMLEICGMLPNTPECMRIRGQLSGAGIAVPTNVEEAEGSVTKKDKRHSFVIARKEAREARVLLRIISGKYLAEEVIAPDIQESTELVNILSTIIEKLGS
jgi:four helix bundle protein